MLNNQSFLIIDDTTKCDIDLEIDKYDIKYLSKDDVLESKYFDINDDVNHIYIVNSDLIDDVNLDNILPFITECFNKKYSVLFDRTKYSKKHFDKLKDIFNVYIDNFSSSHCIEDDCDRLVNCFQIIYSEESGKNGRLSNKNICATFYNLGIIDSVDNCLDLVKSCKSEFYENNEFLPLTLSYNYELNEDTSKKVYYGLTDKIDNIFDTHQDIQSYILDVSHNDEKYYPCTNFCSCYIKSIPSSSLSCIKLSNNIEKDKISFAFLFTYKKLEKHDINNDMTRKERLLHLCLEYFNDYSKGFTYRNNREKNIFIDFLTKCGIQKLLPTYRVIKLNIENGELIGDNKVYAPLATYISFASKFYSLRDLKFIIRKDEDLLSLLEECIENNKEEESN